MKPWGMLVLFLVAAFAASLGGALFPPGEWYAGLSKPSWNPPSWIFAPVWTTLYILMAVAGWLLWREEPVAGRRTALGLWWAQLGLNALWTPLFFGLNRPGLAFFEICLLWLALAALVAVAWKVRRLAAILLLPYAAWVSFAAVLNGTLWQMNG